MLRVSILRGPDQGLYKTFRSSRVSIGGGEHNDLTLHDEMVSRFHGLIEFKQDDEFTYKDLGSLNGTLLLCNAQRHHLHNRHQHQTVVLKEKARIAMGQTLLEVEVAPENSSRTVSSLNLPRTAGLTTTRTMLKINKDSLPSIPRTETPSEGIVRRPAADSEQLAKRFSSGSTQMQVLFRLSRELNALNRLEDILERVVNATFEMFPTALFARTRSGAPPQEFLLSQSLLSEVVNKHESVIYVQDGNQHAANQSILMAQITACLAAPLIGQQNLLGVMQVDSRGRSGMFSYDDLDRFTLLASSAAFAMERAELTGDIYEMFEAFVQASVAAIDARDPTTAGHSHRVADYTLMLARTVNDIPNGRLGQILFDNDELTELRYAALLHDFGKIGVREEVLQKASRLMEGDLQLVLQRLETIRAIRHRQIAEAHFAKLIRSGRPPTSKDLEHIAEVYRREVQRLDLFEKTLRALQVPRALTDDDRRVVEEMARFNYTGTDGRVHALLDEKHLTNLLIPHGTLNTEERRHIESHAALSLDYLSRIPWRGELSRIPCIAGDHHEKLNGRGYPRGLTSEHIIPQVRMLTIADIFDALTAADRPYKRAKPASVASDILHQEAKQGMLDSDLVELFIEEVVPSIEMSLPASQRED